MSDERRLLDRIRARGEEVINQLSAEIRSSPRFAKAVEGAMRGREKLEEAAAKALRQMNLPTRDELRRATARIEALEREVMRLRRGGTRDSGARQSGKPAARRGPKRPAVGKTRSRRTKAE